MFLNNGALDGDTGGVPLENALGPIQVFEFNTVVGNEVRSTSARASGLHCPATTLVASSNIVVAGGATGTAPVVDTSCGHQYSLFDVSVAGTGNIAGDPQFENELSFRLRPTSPCIDAGDPGSSNDVDLEGDARPQGSAPDIGADEAS